MGWENKYGRIGILGRYLLGACIKTMVESRHWEKIYRQWEKVYKGWVRIC